MVGGGDEIATAAPYTARARLLSIAAVPAVDIVGIGALVDMRHGAVRAVAGGHAGVVVQRGL